MLDDDTLHEMKKPRCGDPDVGFDGMRRKRYATLGQWSKTNLTYYLSYGDDLKKADQSRIVARAFKYWSDVSVLKFKRTYNYNKTDIRIRSGYATYLLRLSVEYAMREVSRLSFTVKTLLLSGATEIVSIGNISCY